MRTLLCLALVSSIALAPAALGATPVSRAAGDALKNDIEGQYRLETGRDVRLTLVGDRLYLDLNRSFRKELLPVADRMLASRDGRFTVQYMPEGAVERILIRHPALPAQENIGELGWYPGK